MLERVFRSFTGSGMEAGHVRMSGVGADTGVVGAPITIESKIRTWDNCADHGEILKLQ